MAYTKHNFKRGDILYASQLNEIEDQIALNEDGIGQLSKEIADINWDDLGNKSILIEWDGNTEGRTVVSPQEGWSLVHVSDAVLTYDQLIGTTATITVPDGSTVEMVHTSDNTFTEGGCLASELSVIIPQDNYVLDSLTFPKKGVYFLREDSDSGVTYVSCFHKEIITPVPEGYLPDISWENLKDRPFYAASKNEPIFENIVGEFTWSHQDMCNVYTFQHTDGAPFDGAEKFFVIWDGVEFRDVELNEYGYISIDANGLNFCIDPSDSGSGEIYVYDYAQSGTHTFSVYKQSEEIKTLDPKFLPDVSWNNLKDRPFYAINKNEPIFENITSEFTYHSGTYFAGFDHDTEWPFSGIEKFVVVWDGVEYRDVLSEQQDSSAYKIGPGALISYPFAMYHDGYAVTVMTKQEGSHTFSVYKQGEETIKTLDSKFLPEDIAQLPEVVENLTATDVNADPAGTAESLISTHDSNAEAHPSILEKLANISWNDLTDKPTYAISTTDEPIFENITGEFKYNGLWHSWNVCYEFQHTESSPFSTDEKYVVIWDGVEYRDVPCGANSSSGYVGPGDTAAYPFAMFADGDLIVVLSKGNVAGTHTFSVYRQNVEAVEIVKTLDQLSETFRDIDKKIEDLTAADVEADPTGTASGLISAHDSSTEAHPAIRELITTLTTRLNTLIDSDDTTLDQLSEIVAYIKNNKSLIDSITTDKVNVADVVDDLVSTATDKPLSANQGRVLSEEIGNVKQSYSIMLFMSGSELMNAITAKEIWTISTDPRFADGVELFLRDMTDPLATVVYRYQYRKIEQVSFGDGQYLQNKETYHFSDKIPDVIIDYLADTITFATTTE